MEPAALFALAVFLIVYAVTTTKILNKSVSAMAGAMIVAVGLLTFGPEGNQTRSLWPWAEIDWNVVLYLPAAAIFASLLQKTGVAQYLAIRAVKLARGGPRRLLILTALTVFLFSFFLGSAPSLTLFLPVTFLFASEMGLPVFPFLTAQIVAANTGGLFSAVGGMSGLLVSSGLRIDYTSYFFAILPFATSALIVVFVFFPLFWGKSLHVTNERKARILDFDEKKSLRDGPLLFQALLVLVVVTVLFFLGRFFPFGLAVPAWLGAAGLLLLLPDQRSSLSQEPLEGSLPFFLIGILALVGGLTATGWSTRWGTALAQWNSLAVGPWALLGVSGLVSAFLDNVPLTAAAVPILHEALKSLGIEPTRWATDPLALRLWVPIVVGSTLGGGATLFGASNALVLQTARKSGLSLRFWDFAKTGLMVTLLQMVGVGLVLTFFFPGR